jgi:hypothetical protein
LFAKIIVSSSLDSVCCGEETIKVMEENGKRKMRGEVGLQAKTKFAF